MKKSQNFFKADLEAAKKAGIANEKGIINKQGCYKFICPNCGTECIGKWVSFQNEFHGGTGCSTCGFGIRV